MEKFKVSPKISIVIPAYNEEASIVNCLSSLEINAYDKLFEIIVVDNASTDRTEEFASSFQNVKVISESQKGVMFARQKGYMESNGDIVVFVDADCRVISGWYEQIEDEFQKDPKLAMLSGPYIYYDIVGWRRTLVSIYFLLAKIIYLLVGYMAIFGNMAVRKDVLEKMGGLDTTIAFYGDDTNTARRASKFGKVKFSLKFKIESSGRRLLEQGIVQTPFVYMYNFFSQIFLKKSASNTYKDYR